MAKINIYGELNAATGDAIIADAAQVRYDNTTVKAALDNVSIPLVKGTGELSVRTDFYANQAQGKQSTSLGGYGNVTGTYSTALGGVLVYLGITGPANTKTFTINDADNTFRGDLDRMSAFLLGNSMFRQSTKENCGTIVSTAIVNGEVQITLDRAPFDVAKNKALYIFPASFVTGDGAFSSGFNTVKGYCSQGLGYANVVLGNQSSVFGYGNYNAAVAGTAAMYGSHNESYRGTTFTAGQFNINDGVASTVLGAYNKTSNSAAFATGGFAHAKGEGSVALGALWTAQFKVSGAANATTYTITQLDADTTADELKYYVGTIVTEINGAAIKQTLGKIPYVVSVDSTNKTFTTNTTLSKTALTNASVSLAGTIAYGDYSFAMRGIAGGLSSFVANRGNKALGSHSAAFGNQNTVNNTNEFATGQFNLSHTGNTAADRTAFSIGNGTGNSNRSNLFEIMQNGDVNVTGKLTINNEQVNAIPFIKTGEGNKSIKSINSYNSDYNKASGANSIALGATNLATGEGSIAISSDYSYVVLSGEANATTYTATDVYNYYGSDEIMVVFLKGGRLFDADDNLCANITDAVIQNGKVVITVDKTLSSTALNEQWYYTDYAISTAQDSIALGHSASTGRHSISIGFANANKGIESFVGGGGNYNNSNSSAVFGDHNHNLGHGSFVAGGFNLNKGDAAFCAGDTNLTTGYSSFAIGEYNVAKGVASVAMGGSWVLSLKLTGSDNAVTYTYTIDDPTDDVHLSKLKDYYIGSLVTKVGDKWLQNEGKYPTITAIDPTNKTITFSETLSQTALSNVVVQINASIAHGNYSFAMRGIAGGGSSFVANRGNVAVGNNATAFGNLNVVNNNNEFCAGGQYNLSHNGSTTADKTAFSIGNGTSEDNRSNLFEIMQNGDIYVSGNKLGVGNGAIYAEEDGAAGAWHATLSSIGSYYNGLTIQLHLAHASANGVTFAINDLPACRVYRLTSSDLSTYYGVGCIMTLTYVEEDGVGKWKFNDYTVPSTPTYASNITWTQCRQIDTTSIATTANQCLLGVLGNGNVSVLSKTVSSGTAKKVITTGLDLSEGIFVKYAVASNPEDYIGADRAYKAVNGQDSRLFVNASTFTQYSRTFLKFTKGADGLYYFANPDTTGNTNMYKWSGGTWWVNDNKLGLPTDATELAAIESQGLYFYELGTHTGGTSNRTITINSVNKLWHVENGQWKFERINK